MTCTLGSLFLPAFSATAKSTDALHYAIGGGPVISLPARENHILPRYLGVGWDMNLQCGMLDPGVTVKNQLNGITDGFQDMMGSMLTNATSAVMSLPGYYLQKKDPGLYDMLTNGVLQGKFDFDNGRTSCEAMTETMGEMTPDSAYSALARAQKWTEAVKSGDAVRAKNEVLDDMGDSGITWVGGIKAGGRNQPAINVTTDVAEAGFEMLADDQQKANKEGLYRYWDNAQAMSEWVTQVIGSQSLQTGMDKTQTASTAGIGLHQDVASQTQSLNTELRQAVLNKEANDNFPIALIDALNENQVDDDTISRIASELALTHTIEKALYARRALLSGRHEVNIAQHSIAQKDVDKAVAQLEQEINLLKYEADVRQSITPRSALAVVDGHRYQRAQSVPDTPSEASIFLEQESPLNVNTNPEVN
ncbi:integrating conjugative element protein [Vibrio mediterranei]|uniref:integrating conjugative element protein n=1 Tax=Vibrio mediterranei TaxID=689 RepID=UPI0038CF51FC